MKKLLLAIAALALSAVGVSAQSTTYKIDAAHSSANFSVKHMMVSTVRGRFTDVAGEIVYTPKEIWKSSVTAVIKAATVNTDNSMRDKHLNSADFFETEKYPEIKFQSTHVRHVGGDKYVAVGNLTIKDVTKQVEIAFTLATGKGMKGEPRLGAEGQLGLNRFDYHVAYDPTGVSVSKDVNIELSVEAAGK